MNLLIQSAAQRFRERQAEANILRWPSNRFENDFEGFCYFILGIKFWAKQREFALLLQNEHRVAVKAGQKVAKTLTLCCFVLWYFCLYPDALVLLTAPSYHQVKDVLWRQLKLLFEGSGICWDCKQAGSKTAPCPHSCKVDGRFATDPHTGLKAGNRAIIGLAVRDPDAMSGRSGAHVAYVLDEVIGIEPRVFEAIVGALAGGAGLYMASNPTESDPGNEFFKAFHSLAHLYKTITISSYDSPNVTGEFRVEGCATLPWIEEQAERWGKDSPQYKGRILGEFGARSSDAILTETEVKAAQIRWDEPTDISGILSFGVDIAGSSMGNDSWSFAVRRGFKIIELSRVPGFDTQDGLDHLHGLLTAHRREGEIPRVAFDGSSKMGQDFSLALGQYSRKFPQTIQPIRLQPSAASPNDRFFRLRDFLLWNMCDQIQRHGLAIPPDPLLEEELLALRWDLKKSDSAGLDKIIDKRLLRELLKRSPDSADAISYSLFGIDRDASVVRTPAQVKAQRAQAARAQANPYSRALQLNPYRR